MISKLIDSVIGANATDEWSSQIVPVGKKIWIKRIGVSIPNGVSGYAQVFWGNAAGWKTLATLCSTFEKQMLLEIVGDGSKTIRILRKNGSASPTVISVWIEGN